MEAKQHRPQGQDAYEDENKVMQGIKVGLKTALDDDPNAPNEEKSGASNYQSKVTDPTGANSEEAGTTTLVQSFEKMSVNVESKKPEKGGAGEEVQEGQKSKSTDRGVSMKEYLAEKFKPRDEDKALSEVISGTLSGQMKTKAVGSSTSAETGKAISEGISGKISGQKDKTEPVRKPEEEEVATRTRTGSEGTGKSGMMDRIKGVAANLWVRKGSGKGAAQTTTSTNPDAT